MASRDWSDLLFGVRRSVRYHRRREHFFDTWGKWTNGLNIVFGSAAAGAFLSHARAITPVLALLVVLTSTVDVIVGSATAARKHSDLARRFIEIETAMVLCPAGTGEDIARFTAQRLAVEADEPPVMRMLDILCHNELAMASGNDDSAIYRVGWFRRRLAHVVNFDTQDLKTIAPG